MKVGNFKKTIACLMVVGMAVLAGNKVFAAETSLIAPVTIFKSLTVDSDGLRAVNFGTVEAPDGVIETVTISSDGDVSGTATTVGSDGASGNMAIFGEDNAVLVMSATASSCTGTGLSLSDFTFSGSTIFSDVGAVRVRHGATLTMDGTNNDVETGEQTCSYTISASY